jgi:ABC-type lipopolysaccharide export system ATPase subunit
VSAFLRLDGLVKRFAGTLAVDHLSLALERGEILALLGPSGAARPPRPLLVVRVARRWTGRGGRRRRIRRPAVRDGVSPRAFPTSMPARTSLSG